MAGSFLVNWFSLVFVLPFRVWSFFIFYYNGRFIFGKFGIYEAVLDFSFSSKPNTAENVE